MNHIYASSYGHLCRSIRIKCYFNLYWCIHRIIESLRLEKTSKITSSNHQPTTTTPAKPCPDLPCPHIFWAPPGMVTPPLPWAPCSNAFQLFPSKLSSYLLWNPGHEHYSLLLIHYTPFVLSDSLNMSPEKGNTISQKLTDQGCLLIGQYFFGLHTRETWSLMLTFSKA